MIVDHCSLSKVGVEWGRGRPALILVPVLSFEPARNKQRTQNNNRVDDEDDFKSGYKYSVASSRYDFPITIVVIEV